MASSLDQNNAKATHTLEYNSANGVVSRRSKTRVSALVVRPGTETLVGNLVNGDSAFGLVKSLKPRFITHEGASEVGFNIDEISAVNRANIETTIDGEVADVSLNSLVSMLVLSIQKLDDRISDLESRL